MDFAPIVRSPALMDARIFSPEPMGLRADVLRLPLEARVNYDEEKNILFLNFEQLEVKCPGDIAAIRAQVCRVCEPLGHKVYTVVNYEGFVLDRSVEDAYVEMIKEMVQRFYIGVTRFTTSGFMRAKLGDTLARRGLAPYVYETEAEAKASLRDQAAGH